MFTWLKKQGMTIHSSKITNKERMGDTRKIKKFSFTGKNCSLINNLIASEKDCKIPVKPTLLGPLRN